jgi:hypothetical protein
VHKDGSEALRKGLKRTFAGRPGNRRSLSTATGNPWKRGLKIVGIPENTVKTRLFGARKKSAALLKTAGVERGWP